MNKPQQNGILSGVDTEGMSKAQKKKLKAKMRKTMGGEVTNHAREKKADDSDKDDSNPFEMAKEETKPSHTDGLEEPEKPRSFSLPSLASNMND